MKKYFILLLFLTLFFFPIADASDKISIKYDQARIGDEYRFWNGQGTLVSNVNGSFTLDTGDVDIITYSSAAQPFGLNGPVISFNTPDDSFESLFLATKPEGHGLYHITVTLPHIQPEREVEIYIENAERVISSNVKFSTTKEGEYLTLKAVTDQTDIKITYITKLTYIVVADAVAALIFTVVLLGFIVFKRKDIKSGFRLNIKDIKQITGIGVKENENNYEVFLDTTGMKIQKPFGTEPNRIYLRIPFWIVSAVILVVLLWSFYMAITSPLARVWDMLGIFKVVIIFFAGVISVLSAILIMSMRTEKDAAIGFSIIGGGIIWIMFAYLGAIAIVLSVTTAMLIYFLSVLVLEEEEKTEELT